MPGQLSLVIAATALFIGVMSVQAWAQATGTVAGSVLDSSKAALPGVTVELTSELTGSVRSTVTNDRGEFVISALPPGRYSLRAALPGFRTVVQSALGVQVGTTTPVNLQMQLGGVEETITVTTTVPTIETRHAEVGAVMQRETIEAMPLNQRNFIQLVALEPGAHSVRKVPGGGTHFIHDIGGGSYSIHGMSANATEFLYDGMPMRDMIANQVGINPTVDAIEEFRLQSSNYSAAFGGVAGGLVNISSKSGTNQFNGRAWEYFRNDALDAPNFFDLEEPTLSRNQFGGTFGGPIRQGKMFLFASYEGLRRTAGVSRAISVPTMLERQGNFSEFTGVVRNPFTGAPYPGNVIPAGELDPVGRDSLLLLFPEPNRPGRGQNLHTSADGKNSSDQFNVRLDYNLSDSDLLFVRYAQQNVDNILPWGSFTQHPDKFLSWGNPAKNAVVAHTKVFGSNVVNEFRVGYNWFNNFIDQTVAGTDYAGQLGINGLSQNPRLWGIPTLSPVGYEGTATLGNAPNERNNHTYRAWNNLTIQSGNHSLMTGFSVTRFQQNGGAHSNARGSFTFDGRFSGHPIADLILGLPNSAARCCVQGDAKRYFRKSDVGLYVQDDWRLRANLTVNLGLRYDFFGATYEKFDRYNSIDMSQAPNLVVRTAGQDGVPRGLRDPSHSLSPRIGFAYTPNQRTAVRGGFGVFYNSESYYVWGMDVNPPFVDRLSITATEPGMITLANAFPPGLGSVSAAYTGLSEDWREPMYRQWNVDIQRQVPWDTTLSATYVGNRGYYLGVRYPKNVPPNFQVGPIQPRRPIPSIGDYAEMESVSRSWFHGVEFKAVKRVTDGLYLNVSYARSKAMDEGGTLANGQGGSGSLRDPFTRDDDKGLAPYDIPNRVTASFAYQVPFGRGRSGWLPGVVRNWSVQGIVLLEDGMPFTVTLPGDPANNTSSALPDTVPGQDPNDGPRTAVRWYNTAAFERPAPNTFGNSERNSVRGPNFRSVDVALERSFEIGVGSLRFRGEVFNLFNRTNFLQPFAVFGSPADGSIRGALEPRQVQLSVRYQF